MAYRIEYLASAARALAKLDRATAGRVRRAVDALALDPRPCGAKKLVGVGDWRIRVGDYRVVYAIRDDKLVVLIVRIGHRREVYER